MSLFLRGVSKHDKKDDETFPRRDQFHDHDDNHNFFTMVMHDILPTIMIISTWSCMTSIFLKFWGLLVIYPSTITSTCATDFLINFADLRTLGGITYFQNFNLKPLFIYISLVAARRTEHPLLKPIAEKFN